MPATVTRHPRRVSADVNRLEAADRPAHEWYRFVLSYPPHLVRDYLERFGADDGGLVLDPFCGTGTTVVEAKKLGVPAVGIEAHPMAHFASVTKTDWSLAPERLESAALAVAEAALAQLECDGIIDDPQPNLVREEPERRPLRRLPPEAEALLLTNSISPLPLHKTLVLREMIDRSSFPDARAHLRLAMARALVTSVGNLHFGPEVGVGPAKADAPVVSTWLGLVLGMVNDLRRLRERAASPVTVHHADARDLGSLLRPRSLSMVITSPPYPNEKDYTRTTRLESVLLGLFSNKEELRALKKTMLRSNTRGIYKADADDAWIKGHAEIERIAAAIEARRIELNKTSGFERLYARVTKLYFGGMARHLDQLKPFLKPGARLAYVVGDQASYLRVMIRTGQLLASLAEPLGYEVEGIDLFRTRLATATREQLREEVVVLRWPGTR